MRNVTKDKNEISWASYSAFTETGRAETIDSDIFRSRESNVRYKTMKSQLAL